MDRCARCILPTNYPGIAFDGDGVCSYCQNHRQSKYRGRARLLDVVAPYRSAGREHECAVAISGGRDSAFAAHYVVAELKLKALAYTFDNGFMPDQTRANIDSLVRTLGIEHITVSDERMRARVKQVLSAWIGKPSPATIALLCTGCRTGYANGLAKTAQRRHVRLVLTGGGEPHQGVLRSLAVNLLSAHTASQDRGGKQLAMGLGFMREVLRNPLFFRPGCLLAFGEEFRQRYSRPKRSYRELPLFRFVEWQEDTILTTIRNKLGWKKPSFSRASWRSDCKVHLLRQYLYKETLGFTKNDELLSLMVRGNEITREDALARVESENEIPHEFVSAFLDELGLSCDDLDSSLRKYRTARCSAVWRTDR